MKKKIVIGFYRAKDGWKVVADDYKYSMVDRTGVPDSELGNVLEGITYYVENDLGCECLFYCE